MLLLVQGTEDTNCEPIDDKLSMAQQTFKVTSQKVCCLLSESPVHMTLLGYCDFKRMMAYRLDTETALVLASAVERKVPGSASIAVPAVQNISGDDHFVVTVEHMHKITKDEQRALTLSMALEWKSVLGNVADTATSPGRVSSRTDEYWSAERTPKMRRIQSEPQSPGNPTGLPQVL